MGIVVVPTFGADPVTVTGPTLDAKVAGLATEFNGSIDDDNIKAAASISNSKLNLASISQNIAHSGTMTHSGVVTMSGKRFNAAKSADIASATTTTIWATDGNFAHITGTTTITSFGTATQAGAMAMIVFDGILTLTHNATSLILPAGANITTAAGDSAIVLAETTANARVINYYRKDGTALSGGTVPSAAAQSDQETGTSTTTYVSPGRQQYHASACKAWVNFNGSGTPAVVAGYNVSSITDNGSGDWTVNFTVAMSSASYAALVTPTEGGGAQGLEGMLYPTSALATGSFRISVMTGNGNSRFDSPTVCAAAFGDQ